MATSSLDTDSALTESFVNITSATSVDPTTADTRDAAAAAAATAEDSDVPCNSNNPRDQGTGLPSSSSLSHHNPSSADPLTRGNNTPPPPYSGPPQQPLFIPYITQGLPGYSQASESTTTGQSETHLGFVQQGGSFIPIQIPGYICTDHEATAPPHRRVPVGNHTRITVTSAPRRTSNQVPSSLATVHPQTRTNMSTTAGEAAAPATHNDYLKVTFVLLVCCILQLNFPAVLCSLSALGCSVKARDLWTSGMYEHSKQYSNMTLFCDALAVLEYLLLIIAVFVLFLLVFVYDVQLIQ